MNRRRFLGVGPAALVAQAVTGSGQAGQTAPPGAAPSRGDPLYDPSAVQEHAPVTALDNDPGIKALEHRLKCTCGCNLDIYTCRTTDFTCTYSPALHQEVMALRKQSRTDDEIVDAFVAKYGESILMAPKPVGFNLAGYLVPGILVTLVALVLAWILMRRSRVAAVAVAPGVPPVRLPSPTDDERLRQALSEVED